MKHPSHQNVNVLGSINFFSAPSGHDVFTSQPRIAALLIYDQVILARNLRNLTALATAKLLLSFSIPEMAKESSKIHITTAIKFLW